MNPQQESRLRVIKEVPLTWIVSGFLVIVGQAGAIEQYD